MDNSHQSDAQKTIFD